MKVVVVVRVALVFPSTLIVVCDAIDCHSFDQHDDLRLGF